MVYKSNWNQERIKRENRDIILALLNEEARTFTQLLKTTGFSPMGLSTMLADLQKEKKIEKRNPKNKKSAYKIKGSGMRAKELLFPGREINDLRDSGKWYIDLPNHMESLDFNFTPLFGITSYLLLDRQFKKNYKPFWRKEMLEIEKFVYDKFYTKYHRGGLPILKEHKGKIFVILEIDYNDITNLVKTRTVDENEKLVKDKIKELKLYK